jgi:hypothetical protein
MPPGRAEQPADAVERVLDRALGRLPLIERALERDRRRARPGRLQAQQLGAERGRLGPQALGGREGLPVRGEDRVAVDTEHGHEVLPGSSDG